MIWWAQLWRIVCFVLQIIGATPEADNSRGPTLGRIPVTLITPVTTPVGEYTSVVWYAHFIRTYSLWTICCFYCYQSNVIISLTKVIYVSPVSPVSKDQSQLIRSNDRRIRGPEFNSRLKQGWFSLYHLLRGPLTLHCNAYWGYIGRSVKPTSKRHPTPTLKRVNVNLHVPIRPRSGIKYDSSSLVQTFSVESVFTTHSFGTNGLQLNCTRRMPLTLSYSTTRSQECCQSNN